MKDFTPEAYRALLSSLLNKGYMFCTFEEYCNNECCHKKFVILRHDVDLKPQHSFTSAKIENELGIKATYYFRIVPESNQPQYISGIKELGHEIGYHYEDLTITKGNSIKAYESYSKNLEYFKRFYPVRTISMHGSPSTKFDNRDIWKNFDYKSFGIIGEPYFDFLTREDVIYFTDTGRMWNGSKFNVRDKSFNDFKKNESLNKIHTTFDLIDWVNKTDNEKPIMITTHPQRWTDNKMEWWEEYFKQNAKNIVKRGLIYLRRKKIDNKNNDSKNIIIYLGHPAQYHFYKNFISIMTQKGHKIKVLIKSKDILENLIVNDKIDYINIQPKIRHNDVISIFIASVRRTKRVYQIAKNFKADVLLGTDSSVAQAGRLLGAPSITTLEDDYSIIKRLADLTFPFTSSIVVPRVCDVGKWNEKKIPYDGYMKLAYLHPNYFTPSETIKNSYIQDKKYILIRWVNLSAHHDRGIHGLKLNLINTIITDAKQKGYSTYISSETKLSDSLKKYEIKISPQDIHHILAFASILISDSQSMSVEAAILGVPSLRFSDFSGKISVLEELEKKYKLTVGFKTNEIDNLMEKFHIGLNIPDIRKEYLDRRNKMLADKIDVTAFMVWFVENYPESSKIIRSDENYSEIFKLPIKTP